MMGSNFLRILLWSPQGCFTPHHPNDPSLERGAKLTVIARYFGSVQRSKAGIMAQGNTEF